MPVSYNERKVAVAERGRRRRRGEGERRIPPCKKSISKPNNTNYAFIHIFIYTHTLLCFVTLFVSCKIFSNKHKKTKMTANEEKKKRKIVRH